MFSRRRLALLLGAIGLALLFALVGAGPSQAAPPVWSSPGTGQNYNLSSLEADSGGIIQDMGPPPDCHFNLQDYLRISNGDTLTIDAGCSVEFDQPSGFIIEGRLLVNGTFAAPVIFNTTAVPPAPGDYDAVEFVGVAFLGSRVNNLSINFSSFGLKCTGCADLAVANLTVNGSSGDAVFLNTGASNISLINITEVVTTYSSQSVVGANRVSNLTGYGFRGTGSACVLTLWNATNVSLQGPVVGSGIVIAGSWIDNGTNVTIGGLAGGPYPTGFRIARSSYVTVADTSISSATLAGLNATLVDRLTVTNFGVGGGAGFGILLSNVTNARVALATLSTTQSSVYLVGSTNISLSRVDATSTSAPLFVNRSGLVSVNESTFSGGTPGSVYLNGSTSVTLTNVSVTGGANGFYILSSPATSLVGCIASGSLGAGVQVALSSGLIISLCQISANDRQGVSATSAADLRIVGSDISYNRLEGIALSQSTLNLTGSSVSNNTLDGIVLTNASRVSASASTLVGNGHYGLWARSGNSTVSGLSVRSNLAGGILVEGATLFLTDGAYENNTAFGISYDPAASGGWTIVGAALLSYNDAVLTGGVNAMGGTLTVLSSIVSMRGLPPDPFRIALTSGATLWLDASTLRPADAAARYRLVLQSDARLVAIGSALLDAGSLGVAPAVDGQSATLEFTNSSILGLRSPFVLHASTLVFTGVAASGSAGARLQLLGGTSLASLRLTMTGLALQLDASDAVFLDATLAALAGPAVELLNGATLRGTRFFLDGVDGDGMVADGATLALDDSSVWNVTGVGVGGSLGAFKLTKVTLGGIGVDGINLGSSATLEAFAVTVRGAGRRAVSLDSLSGANLTNFTAEGYAADGIWLAGGARITIRGATLRGGLNGIWVGLGVLDASGLVVELASDAAVNATLSSSVFLDGANLSASPGLALSAYQSSSVVVRNATLASSGNVAVQAWSVGQLELRDLVVSAREYGILVDHAPAAILARVRVSATTQACVWIAASDNATLSELALAPQSGTGLLAGGSGGLVLTNSTIVGGNFAVVLNGQTQIVVDGLTSERSAGGVEAWFGDRANFSNSHFLNATLVGIDAGLDAEVDLWNSSIVAGFNAPGFQAAFAADDARIRFFDSAADNASFLSTGNGTIEVWWTLQFLVLDAWTASANTTLWLRDASNGAVRTQLTDSSGFTLALPTMELQDVGGNRTLYSPFTANATAAAGFGGAASFNLTAPSVITVNLADLQSPTLEIRGSVRTVRFGVVAFGPDPFGGDRDNVGIVRYEWSFVNETGQPVLLSGPSANYTFVQVGTYIVTVRAYDAAGNFASRPFTVKVNAPPYFLNVPGPDGLVGVVGRPIEWDFTASDNDTEDLPFLRYTFEGVAGSTASGGAFSWTPSESGVHTLTVSVSDGYDTLRESFDILVGLVVVGNRPPTFVTDPVEGADVTQDYLYEVTVDDADGDTVAIRLLDGPAGMVFSQTGALRGRLTWTPSNYYPRGSDAYNVTFNVSLFAWDTHAFGYQNFTMLLRNPPDEPPVIVDFADISLGPGDEFVIDLRQLAHDADDLNVSTLRWAVLQPTDTLGTSIGFDTLDPFKLVFRAPKSIEGTKSFVVTFKVTDTSGKSDERVVTVTLRGPTTSEAAFPWLLLLLLVGGAGVVFALATRQRAGLMTSEAAATETSTSPRAPPSAPAGDAGFPFLIEGVVLIDRADNVIATASDGADLQDVFVLVPSKAHELDPREGALAVGSLEGRGIALMRKGEASIAAVGQFAGDPSPWLAEPVAAALEHVQARASELNALTLESVASDPGIAEALRGIMALSAGSSSAAVAKYRRESTLRVASVVEHVGGFLRLKIAVDNNSGQIAADARLSVEFDDKVLRMERIEPAVEQKRDRIQLGNLRPGERKTVALYFDPQICTRSFFNATAGWEDAQGKFHSTSMRTRQAEVVCPSFSTPTRASTAMLKRLLQEELAFRDSKYFRFPEAASPEQIFDACRKAVLAHDVHAVKEFVTEKPYQAEAWFYGQTQVKKSPVVIWTAVFGTERVAQFSVASNGQASITGLLAELGRFLVASRQGGLEGAPIETMRKASAPEEIARRATLLSKSQEGQIDPNEDLPPS